MLTIGVDTVSCCSAE